MLEGRTRQAAALAAALTAAGCATGGSGPVATAPAADSAARDSAQIRNLLHGTPGGAWRSAYEPLPSEPVLIRDATVMTATGREIEGGDVLLRDGHVAAVGRDLDARGAREIDASGRYVTPGLIDTHSHMGDYPDPEVQGHFDGNEATDPVTAGVWAEHSIHPQDPSFTRALAAGVTTVQVLPGSANLVGGRGVTLRMVPRRTVQAMKFPGAPQALKMACGENPKRVYGDEGGPSTRMGNVAGYRRAFVEARAYRDRWDEWADGGAAGDPPERDLGLETLAEVLRGNVLVHMHCYRADEMVQMLNLAREFGFRIRSFHHATEAYKVRDHLARDSVAASMWYDWWGFKMEAFDAVPQNLALVSESGAPAVLHTDSDLGVQVMNQDAARAMHDARAHGLDVGRDEALRWITANPAWALGLADETGTLEAGKRADVVIWSHDPFSIHARADQVFIDGALVYDRSRRELRPTTDFEAGILPDRAYGGEEEGR